MLVREMSAFYSTVVSDLVIFQKGIMDLILLAVFFGNCIGCFFCWDFLGDLLLLGFSHSFGVPAFSSK